MRSLVLICAVLMPLQATAQGTEDEKLAKRYFQLGKELYGRADYAGALKQFQSAYKHAARPLMRYNIARCHEALGQHREAIAAYKSYLESKPADAKLVESRITNLEGVLAKKRKEEKARQETLEREREARKALEEKTAKLAAENEKLEQKDARGRGLFWAGWSSVGGGAALLATSVIFGALASGKASDLEEANEAQAPFSSVRDDIDSGEAFETVQVATLIAGGVGLIAGGVLLYLHYGRDESATPPAVSIVPSIGPNSAALQAQMRF